MQRNSLWTAHDGGPVVLRPVRATPCYKQHLRFWVRTVVWTVLCCVRAFRYDSCAEW